MQRCALEFDRRARYAAGKGRSMNPKDAFDLLQKNAALVIDIREAEELKESGTAVGALWMPTSKIMDCHDDWNELKQKLPKDKPIAMYCKSGGRVSRVAAMLCPLGYNVENIGGFKDWQAAGLPVKPFLG